MEPFSSLAGSDESLAIALDSTRGRVVKPGARIETGPLGSPSKAPRGQYQGRAYRRGQERYEQALPEHDRQQRGEEQGRRVEGDHEYDIAKHVASHRCGEAREQQPEGKPLLRLARQHARDPAPEGQQD